jgi:hypothetical protein
VFSWVCVDDTDPACPNGGTDPEAFPDYVAVGARFRMQYRAHDDDLGWAEVHTETVLVDESSNGLVAKAPGWAAIVAMRDGMLLDVIHLQIAEPDHVQVDGDIDAPLALGEERTLQASARTQDGELCAGSLPYEWSVDRAGVVELIGGTPGHSVEVIGQEPGEAELLVKVDSELFRTLSLTVEGETDPTGLTGDTGPTGPTGDTGPVDTDTDTDTVIDTSAGSDTGALVSTGGAP